jgi:imidazolonepropionase-like amidohydrolase
MKKQIILFIAIFTLSVTASSLISCSSHSLLTAPSSKPAGYLITNVSVFTAVKGRLVIKNAWVHVKGKHIVKISAAPFEVPGAEVIDGTGMTLLPGLIDSHTHISSGAFIPWKPAMLPTMDYNFEACLYSGITAVIDMGGMPSNKMGSISAEIESGAKTAPHLFYPGIGFTAPESHPEPFMDHIKNSVPFYISPFVPDLAYTITSVSDMDKLEKHFESKPDFTKVFVDDIPAGTPEMSLEVLKEIVRRSHARNIPVFVHIGSNDDLKKVIDSGADGAAHNVYKEKIDPALARELARKKIIVIPTIFVWDSYDLFVNKKSTTHYTKLELETIHPDRLKELMNPFPASFTEPEVWADWNRRVGRDYVQNIHANLAVLKEAGVIILAGTDTPGVGISSGGSLHVELGHMVKGGMSPTEVLLSATSVPAQMLRDVMRKKINYGTVEEGRDADLLLVRGDPTVKITDTQNIEAVFFQGTRIERKVLSK